MIEAGVFCIDLDHTLGNFLPLAQGACLDPLSPDPRLLGLREGAGEALSKLRTQGFKTALTTSASLNWAKEVLVKTGINEQIDDVFEGSQIFLGSGKLYLPVAEMYNLSPERAQRSMIAIGDLAPDDLPVDVGIVTLIHPQGFRFRASLLTDLVDYLGDLGRDSFKDGFEKQYSSSASRIYTIAPREGRLYRILGDVVLSFEYQPVKARTKIDGKASYLGHQISVPVMKVMEAISYLSK